MLTTKPQTLLTRRGSKLLVEVVIGIIGILGIMLAQVAQTGTHDINVLQLNDTAVSTQVSPNINWMEVLF